MIILENYNIFLHYYATVIEVHRNDCDNEERTMLSNCFCFLAFLGKENCSVFFQMGLWNPQNTEGGRRVQDEKAEIGESEILKDDDWTPNNSEPCLVLIDVVYIPTE